MATHLRVFQLINSLQYGGAENMLTDLVETIDDVEFTVGYMESDADLVSKLIDSGVTVKSFNERFRFDPIAIRRLRRFLQTESFDIVHAHLPYAQTIGRLTAIRSGVDNVISTQHNVSDNYHPVTRITEQVTRSLDTVSVAVSNGVERSFTGTTHTPNKIGDSWCTIYNGIDVNTFREKINTANIEAIRADLDIDPETLTLLNVGRYVPVKRQREVIQIVAQADFDTTLLIVGDGPLKEELRSLATQLGVSDSVRVTGRVENIEPYYAIGDVFITPSRGEGLPITLLEAMATGLPIIATDIPGIREVVDNEATGLLYPPGDVDKALAHLNQLRDTKLRLSYGQAGLNRVQTVFSVAQMANTYKNLYNQVAHN